MITSGIYALKIDFKYNLILRGDVDQYVCLMDLESELIYGGEISINFLLILPIESSFKGTYNVFFGLTPPLGLLYLAKILEQHGDQITILDFSAEEFSEHKLTSALHSIDVVGMTMMSSAVQKTNEIVRIIKEKDPEIKTIIGGPHSNLFPKRTLEETQGDISIQGDGEKVILEIKKALNNEKQFSKIPGVFYKTKNKIISGPPFQPISDLDSIPFPARHLVKKYTYGGAYNPNIKKGEFTSILMNRGCPYNCYFCSRGAINLNQYRTRSTKNILEELREIQNNSYKYLAIMDDAFLTNKKQAETIFNTIIAENIELKIYITASRADSADKNLYKKMKKAGVVSIQFGLESGNQDVLDFYNKKTSVEKIRQAVNLSHETGFFTTGTFILGAPFETKEHFEKTIKFAKSLPLDGASILPLRYMAGAELWEKAVDNNNIESNEYELHADLIRNLGVYTEKELLEFCKKYQRLFYTRPSFFINLLRSSLEKNDLSIFQMLISIYISYFKERANLYKIITKKESNLQRENNTMY